MLASVLIGFISIMAVTNHIHAQAHVETATAGLVGLGLAYATPIIGSLSAIMTTFTETEQEMVSVERMQQYMNVTGEIDEGQQEVSPVWPARGAVEFTHVSLLYYPWLPPALNDVTFSIRPCEHIGIAGRTGAGKSSILNSLFRLTPISAGSIVIDGVTTSHVALQRLRSRLTIVPQSPFLFGGSIRKPTQIFSSVSRSSCIK
jgi:ATP-binding cassette subfamily C (CFTR/MRP) protein 10